MPIIDYSDPGTVEAIQLEQRRRAAEAQYQQAVQGNVPAFSGRAALARALTGILGAVDMGNAEKRQRELAKGKQDESRGEMDKLMDFLDQKPPTVGAGLPQVDDEGNQMPGNVSDAAEKRKQLARTLVGSSNPQVAGIALQTILAKPKEEEAFTLKPGESRYKGNKVVAALPDKPAQEPDSIRTLRAEIVAAGIDPNSDMGKKIFNDALTKATTHQPAPSVTVNTDKKFGQVLATNVAEQVAQSADSARGAIDTLNTAKQIETALASGKVMAGPGTTGLMLVQQAIGAPSSQEGLVQTRQVIQGLSQMTLNSRKQLKGQGAVSDFEGKLLERAASGDIDRLTVPEIQSLVKTATRLANGAITQHQSYLAKIKADPELKNLAPFFDFQVPQSGSNPSVEDLVNKYGRK